MKESIEARNARLILVLKQIDALLSEVRDIVVDDDPEMKRKVDGE